MSCCRAGAVKLDLLQEPPAYLQNLFLGAGAEERAFRNALRRYNSAFAFTSVGYDQPGNSTNRNFMPFQAHGEMYHLQGPLASGPHNDARYSQLYIYDPEYAANLRCTTNSDLNRDIIENLTREINECNPHVALYKSVHELLENNQESSVVISPSLNLRLIEGNDRRTENLPTSNEIAAIIPTSADANTDVRDIRVYFREDELSSSSTPQFHRISQNHSLYMPLHYVLIFPKGDLRWS